MSEQTLLKTRRSQVPLGLVLLAAMIALGLYLAPHAQELSLFLLIGASFGFTLQKSRFCFTASLRDPALTGNTSMTRAVLIALALTTIGFTAIKYGAYLKGLPIPGQDFIAPISLATATGAFMFGVGMVIAGGCASGTLMRIGEGFFLQIIVLFFFIIGSLWGAHDFNWWRLNFIEAGPRVFLPNLFGWLPALILQLILIAGLFILADKWQNKRRPLP